MSRTIRLPAAPLSTYTPIPDDEADVYPEAIVYRLSPERSEMWAGHWYRAQLLEDVSRAVGAYARPIVLAYADGHAVGILSHERGLQVEDAWGRELCATAA